MAETPKGERIAKVIARAGLCSRRDAEAWIAAGRVSLDGQVLDSPGALVTDDSRIEVDGVALPEAEPPRLWRYHKPRGELTTARDPQGRATVFDRLPADLPRLQAVGRLDINSEGLLLMTNDGALKRQLELPSNGWLRRYRARVRGRVSPARLAALEKGVTVEGVSYGPVEAQLDQQTGANAWLTMGLREGKNREVRKICAHLGLTVNRLIRVSYGPFVLGKLPNRALEEVPSKRLREALGLEEEGQEEARQGLRQGQAEAQPPGLPQGLQEARAQGKRRGRHRGKETAKGLPQDRPRGEAEERKEDARQAGRRDEGHCQEAHCQEAHCQEAHCQEAHRKARYQSNIHQAHCKANRKEGHAPAPCESSPAVIGAAA